MDLIENKQFENIDFQGKGFSMGEYENCKFIKCNFNAVDFSKSVFVDCEFVDSNLSLVKVQQSVFRNVLLRNSKMVGVQFEHLNPFGLEIEFNHVMLDHSSFYKTKFLKAKFTNCSLKEVDFSQADFTASIFDQCDFLQAVFEATILEKADFTTSFNYSIDPQLNKLKKSKHSYPGLLGLLDSIGIILV